ncbi:hypothetical protein B0O99DRAFT_739898 [Bisporella sp. PMI_857]|nr:hypothetical protein B0O99DRAFT_739898 [Bisporella sp. PMI_857]
MSGLLHQSKGPFKVPQKKSQVKPRNINDFPPAPEHSSQLPLASLEDNNPAAVHPTRHEGLLEYNSETTNIENPANVVLYEHVADHSLQAISYATSQPFCKIVDPQLITNYNAAAFSQSSSTISQQAAIRDTTSICNQHQPPPFCTTEYAPTVHDVPYTMMSYQESYFLHRQEGQEILSYQLNRWAYETSDLETTFADRLEKSNWEDNCFSL